MVEDELLLGRLVVRAMEALKGMEAVWAGTGTEGLKLARSWRPDVILLDLVLPEMSGLELLRQYRREGGKARVIVVTGAWEERIKGAVFSLGADYVMSKPARWEEVFSIASMLAGGLERECRELLKGMGASEGSRGFEQAVECAALLGQGECTLLKEAYVEVGRRQRARPGSVSKNIERLAREVSEQGTPLYYRLSGKKAGEKPLTNREFLTLLSQAARIPL